jgi:hypothetical protein
MTKQVNSRMSLLVVAVLAAALAAFGCSDKNTLDTTPADATTQLTISASPTSVETSETSVVEATVTTGGSGVSGQVIQFTVTPSSAGTVTPQVDTTGSEGIAATIFTAAEAGGVVVQAQIVGTAVTSSVGLSVAETGVVSGSGNINVTATRSLLLANGQDTSHVTIVVTDELGQPAPNGTLVKIAAGEKFVDVDGNGYWSAGVDTLVFDVNNNGVWDSFGQIPSTAAIAGGVGQVEVDYISGDEAFTVYIRVTVDEGGITDAAELSVQLSPNAVLHSIYLASDSVSLSVQATGGVETSQLRATGYDIHGNPVPEGMALVFAILDGPGGGEQLDTLAYGPDTAYTNGQGTATTSISSGTVSGTVRIRAYSGTVLSNATQILIAAGPPQYIVVGTSDCNVDYWDNVGEEVGVTAIVSDIYNNPVNDSTVVYFTADEGTMMSYHERTKEGKGIATSTWFSGNNVPSPDGDVIVTAETAGGTVTGSVVFYNTHAATSLWLTGWDGVLLANGESEFYATLEARDLNDNYLVSGYEYEGKAAYVVVADGKFENGCYSSNSEVKVTSKTLKEDFSLTFANDDGIGCIAYVTYTADGGASVTDSVTLLTGPSYAANSSLTGPSTALPGEVLRFMVEVADRYGNPLGDHTMNMTAAGGVVTGATQETSGFGEASGFQWTAPAGEGDYNITVTDTDPRGLGMVLTLKVTVKAAT